MKFLLQLGVLLIGLTGLARAEEPPYYTYLVEVEEITEDAQGFHLALDVRHGRKGHGPSLIDLPAQGFYAAQLRADRARLANEEIYYRFVLSREIPAGRGVPYLDFLTRQTAQDILAMSSALRPMALQEAEVKALTPISQNDFLGIHPRIVKP